MNWRLPSCTARSTSQFEHRNYLRNYSRNLFHIARKAPDVTSRARRVAKERCLNDVRHLIVGPHSAGECLGLFDKWGSERAKLLLRTIQLTREEGLRPHFWYHGCGFAQLVHAGQSILRNMSPRLPTPSLPAATGVVMYKAGQASDLENVADSLKSGAVLHSRPSTIVYLFLTAGPSDSLYKLDQLRAPNGSPSAESGWDRFQANVASDAWQAPDTKEVVIVNIDAVNKAWGPTRVDLAQYLQDRVNARKPGDIDDDVRFDLRIITMRDYVTEYEWYGVLQDEEAEAWL